MQYWLLKTEPEEYSWEHLKKEKIGKWDGVANAQAQKNLKSMKLGDLAFFYHTGKEKAIVGIVEICKEFYLPNKSSKLGQVDVKPYDAFEKSVTLAAIKENASLKTMKILRQPRLSVSTITESEFEEILRMSKNDE
uniref:Thymocyte nuclear protein 1 n=1 Tax=Corethrella appendiculata TaxID=1370023 RepID=U5EUE7_9DIPT